MSNFKTLKEMETAKTAEKQNQVENMSQVPDRELDN
jgi:hypothetical protein